MRENEIPAAVDQRDTLGVWSWEGAYGVQPFVPTVAGTSAISAVQTEGYVKSEGYSLRFRSKSVAGGGAYAIGRLRTAQPLSERLKTEVSFRAPAGTDWEKIDVTTTVYDGAALYIGGLRLLSTHDTVNEVQISTSSWSADTDLAAAWRWDVDGLAWVDIEFLFNLNLMTYESAQVGAARSTPGTALATGADTTPPSVKVDVGWYPLLDDADHDLYVDRIRLSSM